MTAVMSRLRPDDPSRSRHPSAGGPTDTPGIALLPIAADLLPRETAAVGRGRRGRLLALALVAVTVLAVGAAWLLSVQSRAGAETDLAAAQDRQRSLATTQQGFDDLVSTKAAATALRDTLARLMADDIPWSAALTALSGASAGVQLTGIQAATATPSTAAGGAVTGATPTDAVATLAISGTAADKATVAAFVDALTALPGFTGVFVTSVAQSTDTGGFAFTVQAGLTADLAAAAPGRWSTTDTTTGGGK